MVLGLQITPRFFFVMELPRSVQQLLCHQFDLAPTWKARIIYRDNFRGLMLVFNLFHCDLKYIYEQLSTSLHDAFEWAAKKNLAPLYVGLCLIEFYYCISMALYMVSQVLLSASIKEGFSGRAKHQ
jgi:hypothetical protein